MANAKIFRINYKSDFILTLVSDAGWMTPFCAKFWTGAPSQAYYVQWDGETYTHCAPVAGEPTKLQVQFDDHHLPIGDLKYQIAYHFTVDDFPNDTEDEVLNQANITTEIDCETYQVMLDFNGETAPEIEFSLPAYANEAQRIANEEQRIANEQARIEAEQQRIDNEQTRQDNEAQRIAQETARVNEYAELKANAVAATNAANDAATLAAQKAQLAADKAALADAAATLAAQKAQLAADKAALADAAATLANQKAALAQQKAQYAQTQGDYAKAQGDYAKEQGEIAEEDHERAEADHTRAESDHATAGNDHTQAGTDHSTAVNDHTQSVTDHTQADTDHTRAESDHTQAASDHTQAGADHTRAENDHSTASADHTQAGQDHTRAESDHTRAESDHAAVELYIDSLGAFDISAYHATGGVLAKYADLTAALGTNGANIPEAIRKGGMSVKFVQTYDNKYMQFQLMAQSFTTDITQWQSSETTKNIDSNGFQNNTVGSISINQRQSSVSKPFTNVGYAIGGNGKKIVSSNYACTDLLPVIDSIKIGVISNFTYAAIAFYDSNKSFLSAIGFSTLGELSVFHEYTPQIPEGAAYFAVTTLKDEIINSYVLFGNVEQYLANKADFPELMHTVYDADLVKENKIYTDAGVGYTNNDYEAVKFNVSEGDVLRITCNIRSGANYHAVKFYTANGGTLVEAKLLDGDFVNSKLVVPANATFVICQGRSTTNTDNVNHIQLKVDLYSKYKKEQNKFIEYDALMLEPCQGYYRKSSLSLVCGSGTLGFRVSVPIPVIVNDVVTAGTAISYPFDTVVHVLLDANKDIIGTFNMVNGIGTITQAMWDSGARYVAITFRPTDTPSLTITRSANAEPFVLDRTLKMKISNYENNGFILWIPSKQIGGKYVGYRFTKDYKKWDSLEYEDGDGNTQTLTDVVNTDVWNCIEVYDENMQYMAQGNTNFIFSVDGEAFVGDGHGNEASMFSQFLIDGKVKEIVSGGTFFYSVGKVFELDSFECKWKSNIYRHGSGTQYTDTAKPYINTDGTLAVNAEHYLDAKFEYGNKIRLENVLNIKRNNITFMSCNGAMLECNFGDFSYLSVNDDNDDINQVADDGTVTALANSTNLAPGTGGAEYQGLAVNANEVKMWGKDFAIMQRMEPKYNDRLDKCGVYIHKYADRIKCYFHPVITTQTTAIGTKETFNAGDVISVVDYREIEV